MSDRATNRKGRRLAPFALELGRDRTVCREFAMGNRDEPLPHGLLKLASPGSQRHVADWLRIAREVGFEPRPELREARRVIVGHHLLGNRGAVVLLPIEPQTADGLPVTRYRERTHGRFAFAAIEHTCLLGYSCTSS